MAYALTARYHGEDAAAAARDRFDTLHVRRELPDDIEEFAFSPEDGQVHLPALMAEAFGLSRSEARRLLTQGGVRLDGDELDGASLDVPADTLDGAVLQVGRRRFKKLRRSGVRQGGSAVLYSSVALQCVVDDPPLRVHGL